MTKLRLGYGDLNTTPDWVHAVDLLDRGKLYHDPTAGGGGSDAPTRERDISSVCDSACSPGGGSAVLKKSRLMYWTKSYTLYFQTGASYQTAKTNRDVVKSLIDLGRQAQQAAGCSAIGLPPGSSAPYVYLIRQILDETYPTVWTILDGECIPINEEYSSIPIIGMRLELLVMEGAAFLDDDGFPITGAAPPPLPL